MPEISSGIAGVRLGDLQLAVGEILGGNWFRSVCFWWSTCWRATPVVVAAHTSDVWLGGLGLLMTGIAAAAIIVRPARTYLWLGLDSPALIVVYALAIALLSALTRGHLRARRGVSNADFDGLLNAARPAPTPRRNGITHLSSF